MSIYSLKCYILYLLLIYFIIIISQRLIIDFSLHHIKYKMLNQIDKYKNVIIISIRLSLSTGGNSQATQQYVE